MADYCAVEVGEEDQIFAELARTLLVSVQGLSLAVAVAVVAAAVVETGSVRVLEKVVVERH